MSGNNQVPAQVRTGRSTVAPLQPTTLDEMWRMSVGLAKSQAVPSSMQGSTSEHTAANVMAVIETGAELGIPPAAALRSLYIVNGSVRPYGTGLLAIVRRSPAFGGLKEWYEGEPNTASYAAVCRARRKDTRESYEARFTRAQAEAAGLLAKKGPWQAGYADDMLMWRARGRCLSNLFADQLFGLMPPAEAEDMGELEPEPEPAPGADVSDEPRPMRRDDQGVEDAETVGPAQSVSWPVLDANGEHVARYGSPDEAAQAIVELLERVDFAERESIDYYNSDTIGEALRQVGTVNEAKADELQTRYTDAFERSGEPSLQL